jgi:excisionase family DNA binding protein
MTTLLDAPRLLTSDEVAAALRLSRRQLYRHVVNGVLKPVRLRPGAKLLFRADDIEALLDSAASPHPTPADVDRGRAGATSELVGAVERADRQEPSRSLGGATAPAPIEEATR